MNVSHPYNKYYCMDGFEWLEIRDSTKFIETQNKTTQNKT